MGNKFSINTHKELYNDRGVICLPIYFELLNYIGVKDIKTIRSILYVDKTRHFKYKFKYQNIMLNFFYNPFKNRKYFDLKDSLSIDKLLIHHSLNGNVYIVDYMINYFRLKNKISKINAKPPLVISKVNKKPVNSKYSNYKHTIITSLLTTNKDNFCISMIKRYFIF